MKICHSNVYELEFYRVLSSLNQKQHIIQVTQVRKSDIKLARSYENRKATLSYQCVPYDSYKTLPNYNIRIKSYKNRTIRIDMISWL